MDVMRYLVLSLEALRMAFMRHGTGVLCQRPDLLSTPIFHILSAY